MIKSAISSGAGSILLIPREGGFLVRSYVDPGDDRAPHVFICGDACHTHSAERQVVAQDLVDFDRERSSHMAKNPEDFSSPAEVADFYPAPPSSPRDS